MEVFDQWTVARGQTKSNCWWMVYHHRQQAFLWSSLIIYSDIQCFWIYLIYYWRDDQELIEVMLVDKRILLFPDDIKFLFNMKTWFYCIKSLVKLMIGNDDQTTNKSLPSSSPDECVHHKLYLVLRFAPKESK